MVTQYRLWEVLVLVVLVLKVQDASTYKMPQDAAPKNYLVEGSGLEWLRGSEGCHQWLTLFVVAPVVDGQSKRLSHHNRHRRTRRRNTEVSVIPWVAQANTPVMVIDGHGDHRW